VERNISVKVFIGADHRGVGHKNKIKSILETLPGVSVVDVGAFDPEQSCDYPKIGFEVASRAARSSQNRGILLCMSGIGQSIAANKVKGARAALCYNVESAQLSRLHNNANILVLSGRFTKDSELREIVTIWLETPFEGGRHQRRLNQIKKIENGSMTLRDDVEPRKERR
jgi:ribose 5-phosphate isomerase B